ncbi:hypothetical protein C8J56DRAFT_294440 [Mycena floridula]|nr:hypothetical protein C8J56DRAFT_294440 [Mycena floridula]
MKLTTPIPQSLPKECAKAAKIFHSFADNGHGLDGVIPRQILENAKGFAIFTIMKAGFVFSARAGSGIVIAKLDDGTYSAPSAIGTAGLGVGGQLGAELAEIVIVLNSKSAIKSFMAAGSLTLGGNMSIAIGPIGRNGEAIGALNSSGKVAAMYSYSKTRGLFGGFSVEGSVIVERQDANYQAYGSSVTAKQLLGGAIEQPSWASPLIKTLEACTGLPGTRKWVQDSPSGDSPGYAFTGVPSPSESPAPAQLKKKRKSSFPPASWDKGAEESYFPTDSGSKTNWEPYGSSKFETKFQSDLGTSHRTSQSLSQPPNLMDFDGPIHSRSISAFDGKNFSSSTSHNPFSEILVQKPFNPSTPFISSIAPSSQPQGIARAVALYDFNAVEAGDLSFSKGDIITVLRKSQSIDDWWTGKLADRQGIFPANFVELL